MWPKLFYSDRYTAQTLTPDDFFSIMFIVKQTFVKHTFCLISKEHYQKGKQMRKNTPTNLTIPTNNLKYQRHLESKSNASFSSVPSETEITGVHVRPKPLWLRTCVIFQSGGKVSLTFQRRRIIFFAQTGHRTDDAAVHSLNISSSQRHRV